MVRRARSAIRAAWVASTPGMTTTNSSPPRPTEEVAAANDFLQLGGEALEHEIAGIVTVGVVDALEMVDVENHHRQRRAALTCGLDHRRQAALEGSGDC